MTALPPREFPETPWSADAIGVIRSADGRVLGTAHFGEIGHVAEMQMVARLFAASGLIAQCLRWLRKAEKYYFCALKGGDLDTISAAESELNHAQMRSDEALSALKDSRFDPLLSSWRARVPGQPAPEMVRP